ncbi:MAG: M20 family metallopeptidase [Actinobacteria bacterium]|nr:M20 family metallopeptidase [Actinomycetota bacterium]
MDLAAQKSRASALVDSRGDELDRLSLAIHARPELAFEERFASVSLTDYVERQGTRVTRGAGGLETAFVAEAGSGAPVVAFCAEYDALPGVGHACGHNVMGTAAVGAFLAVRDVLDGRGTVRLIGCPAEERGNGKVVLIRAGLFADVDAAVMYHAGDHDELDPLMLALVNLEIEMIGKAAHAAAEPYGGVNALDGLLLGWSSLSALRLVIRSDSRVHGIITDGGQAPNIIPERAAARLMVRSPDNAYLEELRHRVLACFEGAATATGCELRHSFSEVTEGVSTNAPLAEAFAANAAALGRTMPKRPPGDTHGSTDMGNVSTVVPSLHPILSITSTPAPGHSHAFAAAAALPEALETMRIGAKALAHTALDVLADPQLLQRAWSSHNGDR